MEELEKPRTASRGEEPSTDSGFTAESGCLISQRAHKKLKETSMPVTADHRLGKGQEHSLGSSQRTVGLSGSTINSAPGEETSIESRSHKAPVTAMNLLLHPFPVSHSSSAPPHVITKNVRCSIIPDLVANRKCEQTKQGICHHNGLLTPNSSLLSQSAQPRAGPSPDESPVSSQDNSSISGQLFFQQDGLQPQDEIPIAGFCLRDMTPPVGIRSSMAFRAASQLPGTKGSRLNRRGETSVDETIEEVIRKYCYKTLPKESAWKDEDINNSCVNILSLLDRNSVHGSEVSFDCDAAVQSRLNSPRVAVRNLECLKEVQVNLKDESYGIHLSSVLKNGSSLQVAEAEQDVSAPSKEPVLPALPHVPPSFVGKTWSQIMHEDDLKIEALVRDFREGRFRCHFDTDSLASSARRKRQRKKKQEDKGRSDATAVNKTEEVSAKGLPEIPDALSGGSDLSSFSVISKTQSVPQIMRRPKRREWRLASRCQVVKVSHGTQTSLVHYPVVKRKFIRKDHNNLDRKADFAWPESEKTPNMKTRLCALTLPESYTKIMSPLQPQTVVYVLSCPEVKPFKSKPVDVPQMRRSYNSSDSKDSVRYKYKQSCFRYYDPLTNRILKTPPKSIAGDRAKKPPHVRQLFRSLSLDANRKKWAEGQNEGMLPKSFGSPDFHGSSTSFVPDLLKENDMSLSHKTDGSSISTERSEGLVCSNSDKSYKHLVLSPLNSRRSQQGGDFRLTRFNRKEVKPPSRPLVSDCLERDNPKTMWQRKKGKSRDPGFSKKASESVFVRRCLGRRGCTKQRPRTTGHQKGTRRRKTSRALKSSVLPIPRHRTKKTTVGKHLKKEKPDAKKLKVAKKSKRTFLSTTASRGSSAKRRRTTAGSSSQVNKW